MPLLDFYRAVKDASRDQRNALQANRSKLANRLLDVFLRTWDLGFTAFGGPPVHFKIIHERFVEGKGGKTPWIDEQTYQELFAICQGLPGPGSTKMLFCVVLIHAGFVPALFVFLTWSLPGAIGMFALATGVGRIKDTLPDPVYPLLSGLNASTVGIIALAAVQLAEKAINDRLARILIIFGACAGLCYTALWYFPILMVIGGIATILWDGWVRSLYFDIVAKLKKRKTDEHALVEESNTLETVRPLSVSAQTPTAKSDEPDLETSGSITGTHQEATFTARETTVEPKDETSNSLPDSRSLSLKVGISVIVIFFLSFIAVMVVRSVIQPAPRPLGLFANMYLAGTIIFGGGPVVIPLLREYVVQPGWVGSRDFLIGLAIIQAFPGPNFNFAVFLGTLAVRGTQYSTVLGALLGYAGIFIPGITLAVGFQSIWQTMRRYNAVLSGLRGVNATAVGLVFTAVYRLWEIGYLTKESSTPMSLGREPFWLVVAALTYAESAWFDIPPFIAIGMGALLGLCWYGAVGS